MAVRNICVYPDPVLREPTEEITSLMMSWPFWSKTCETMHVYDGIGLADRRSACRRGSRSLSTTEKNLS